MEAVASGTYKPREKWVAKSSVRDKPRFPWIYTSCLPLSRFRSYAVISRASDEHRVVARPWPGGEKRKGGGLASRGMCSDGSFLLPCTAPGVSLLTVWCRGSATLRV